VEPTGVKRERIFYLNNGSGISLHEDLFCQKSAEFGVTLIISPMKGLLVDGVEGLIVRCAYNTDSITLTLPTGANGPGIMISPRTYADVVTGNGGNPLLKMVIRQGHGITGDVIDSAQVGQPITLDVMMEDTTIYDFYVHDCYAHDGSNAPESSISIIDQNGCGQKLERAVEGPVYTTVQPRNGSKHVYVNLYGFQFTTSQLVYFQCHVRPCLQACNQPVSCNMQLHLSPMSYALPTNQFFS
ncbi:unnamed protein product, partial [Soboliphyme baturini]|uniref:ZP domain-containing protein n=1 Tax=Soboliphyme baturini TaxID=241478 RepID=A0A183J026_9BILA